VSEWTEFHEQVEALPEKEKEVFSLRWYDELTFVEIGQVLEVADRTAKRRWRSACVMLHEAMQGDAPGS
jgi:RNA polymerase sigma-70 factor (ECF subfamily)